MTIKEAKVKIKSNTKIIKKAESKARVEKVQDKLRRMSQGRPAIKKKYR